MSNLICTFLPRQTDIDKILPIIQRKVLKGTHLLVEIKEIQVGYLCSPYFKEICHRGEYEYCRNRYTSISYGIFMFLQENTFITPLSMVSLCYIIDDVIVTS